MPLLEFWPDVAALRRDPRVDADESQVQIAPALYVAETAWGPVEHPYQSDVPEKRMNRYLTRVGGLPGRRRRNRLDSFRHASISTEESVQKVIKLQRAADHWARAGERTGEANEADPFNRVPDPVSRVLGLQHYDFDLEEEDVALLQERLPLQDGKDAHRLLLNIASERSFDGVYGDSGRLEVWMRAGDLTQARFDTVVSFWRST